MKTGAMMGIVGAAALMLAAVAGAESEQRAGWREARKEKIQEFVARIKDVRSLGQQFRSAVMAGEDEKAQELLSKFKGSYNSLPEKVRARIEEKHPGTDERIQTLSAEDVDRNVFDDNSQDNTSISGENASNRAQKAFDYYNNTLYTKERFNEADTNKDGYLDSSEIAHASKNFENNFFGKMRLDMADQNNDGMLTLDECHAQKQKEINNRQTILERARERKNESPDSSAISDVSTEENVKTNSTVSNSDGAKTITHEGTVTKTGDGEWSNSGTTTAGSGKTFTNEGTTVKDGNTVTHEGSVTNEQGEVVRTREGTIVKDGNTVSRDATITNEKTGESRTIDANFTKDGDTVSYDKTITTSGGKTIEAEGTITKDGNTLTKDGTISGEKGTLNVDGTLTKDGKTVTGHSEVSKQGGEVVRTKDMTSTKEGDTRTTDVSTKWKGGTERDRENVTKRDGKSVSRDSAVSRTRSKNSYSDDHDILGKGFKKKSSSGEQHRTRNGGASSGRGGKGRSR